MPTIVWFRNDLRLHDNIALYKAVKQDSILPVYVFDPRQFRKTSFGFPKTGTIRKQFLLESIADLNQQLQSIGSNLLILQGLPEQILPDLVQIIQASAIVYQAELASEEIEVEENLRQSLPSNCKLIPCWGQTLLNPEDLPFLHVPDSFSEFRKLLEKSAEIQPPKVIPSTIHTFTPDNSRRIPSLFPLKFPLTSNSKFHGGESIALAKVANFCQKEGFLSNIGYLEKDKTIMQISPWLSHGCLSPRFLYQKLQEFSEDNERKNRIATQLQEQLYRREYYRWFAKKYGIQIFLSGGVAELPVRWKTDKRLFEAWQFGNTGFPLIDAIQRQLLHTGWISGLAREITATFFVHYLGLDWRMGAEWFESQLIDYDVYSNYGNWIRMSGLNSPKKQTFIPNLTKIFQTADPTGEYIETWVTELKHIPAHKRKQPWKLLPVEQRRFGVKIGKDYPEPVVDLEKARKVTAENYEYARLLKRIIHLEEDS
ncbi:MAG: DASH family cryptochrome [Bacteroidia bacterium]|nr:DASH family cryptochrome [Bacteroidia bacterium]